MTGRPVMRRARPVRVSPVSRVAPSAQPRPSPAMWTWVAPASATALRMAMASAAPPAHRWWWSLTLPSDRRTPTQNAESVICRRIARTTRAVSRARLAVLPPYSSARVLV